MAQEYAVEVQEGWMKTFDELDLFQKDMASSEPYGEYLRNKAEAAYEEANDGEYFKTDIFSE